MIPFLSDDFDDSSKSLLLSVTLDARNTLGWLKKKAIPTTKKDN